MSKRTKHVVNLNDYKAKKADEGAILIETDGHTFKVPAPEVWPDEVMELSSTDPIGAARALMGADEYDAFKAAGGSAAVLMSIVADEHGLTAGE